MDISAALLMSRADSPGRKPIWPTSSAARSDHAASKRRHYGRRTGPSLRARLAGLFYTLLPRLALALQANRDPRSYFPDANVSDVWLEIGFGGGEHLLWQAQTHPDIGIIGAEPYVSGVAKLLSKLVPLDSPEGHSTSMAPDRNIRLYTEDAADIIAALPAASLGRVLLLFPDPWPKTRHPKRRFIQMKLLDQLARVMKSKAELRFATDDRGYLLWTLERLCAHHAFIWLAETPADWRARPGDWPETRYEAKAKGAGSNCTYLRFARR